MKLTKTWLSYIVWGIFSIIFFADIGIAAIEINQKNGVQDYLIPILSMYTYTILGVVVVILLYKLFEKFILPKLDGESSGLKGPLEIFVLCMVLFVAVAVRVIAVISAGGNLAGTTEYYDYAVAYGSNAILDTHSNGAYIYGGFLRFLLGFFGHIPTAAIAIQAVVQVFILVILFFMVKKALGRFPAWVALAMASFLPGSVLQVRVCNPDVLFTLFFVLYLLCLVHLCDANRQQKIKIGAHGFLYVLMGVFAAFLAYYDVAGLLAVVIGIVALSQAKNEDAWMKIQRTWLQILIFSVVWAFGFVLLLWFLPMGGLENGPEALFGYLMNLVPDLSFNLMILTPHKGEWDGLALLIMAGLWIVGFLRDKSDKAFPYVFTIVFLTLVSFLGIEAYEYAYISDVAWVMLATVGITSLHVFRKTDRDVEAVEKAKKNSELKKAEKERKRAEAAGEKSIRLDDVPKNRPVKEKSAFNHMDAPYSKNDSGDDAPKKGYGIGRKADAPVTQVAEQNVAVATHKEVNAGSEKVVYEPVQQSIPQTPAIERTVVKKVDRPPLVGAPSPVPVESKPSYSQGSRSRRALRYPSKSTFTEEDLIRISRYTGVSMISSQTIGQNAEPVTETEPMVHNEAVAVNSVETVEPVYEIPSMDVNTASEKYIELGDVTVAEKPIVEEIAVEVPEQDETTLENTTVEEPMIETPMVEDSLAEETSATEEETAGAQEEAGEEKQEEKTVAAPQFTPPRRHYRRPSVSTFSPEELEKIRQYTGMGANEATTGQNPDATITKEEKQVVVEQKPVVQKATETTVKSEEKTVKAEPVKAERKTLIESEKKEITNIMSQQERKPKLIRNPLPGPKPHVSRELTYDYVPKESEMKFDIDDLKGRDYYDV